MIHSLHRFKRTSHRQQVALCLQVILVCAGILAGCGQPAGVVSTVSTKDDQRGSRRVIDEVERKKRSEKEDHESDIARPPHAEMGDVASNLGDTGNPRELLQQIEAQYNIRVTVEGRTDESFYEGGAMSGHSVQDEQLAQIVPILANELNVYSRELFEALYLRQIFLAADLKLRGKPVGGACALATIYLDAGLSSPFASQAIHHELFYMIDRRGPRGQSDLEWVRLNPPDFEYTQIIPTKGSWTLYSAQAGFLTEYSTSSVLEDKAETYALMINWTAPLFYGTQCLATVSGHLPACLAGANVSKASTMLPSQCPLRFPPLPPPEAAEEEGNEGLAARCPLSHRNSGSRQSSWQGTKPWKNKRLRNKVALSN